MLGTCCGLVIGVVVVAWSAPASAAPASAEDLLRDATAGIDGYVDRFRRTGERSDVSGLVRAEQNLLAAARSFTSSGNFAGAALATVKLGHIERLQGHWTAAIAHYETAERLALRAHHPGHRAKALSYRALAELSSRDYGGAAAHAQGAVDLAGPLPDKKLLFDALDVLAQVQIKQSNFNAAAESLNRAFALPGIEDDVLFYGRLDRADVYLGIAERCDQEPALFDACLRALQRCQADYSEAAAMAKRLGWTGLEGQVAEFRQRADVRRQMIESQGRAQGALDKAKLFHPRVSADVLVTEHFAIGGAPLPQAIMQLYQESKRLQQKAGGFGESVQARTFFIEAMVRQSRNDHAGALTELLKAVDVLERDRRTLRDEASRGAFLEDKTEIYVAAVRELLESRRYPEAFDLIERSRARAMSDMLAARKFELADGSEQRLYAEVVRLRSEISVRQARLYRLINGGAARETIVETDGEVARLEEAQRELEARMKLASPRLHRLTVSRTLPLKELQQILAREHADALEYLVTDTGLILWHIGPDAVHVRNVFVPRTELAANIAALRASVTSADVPFDRQRARELYLQLIQPARSWLTHKRLVIVPHDVLNALPFLILEDPADGRTVGERWQPTQAPSATIYAGLRPWSAETVRRVVAAADPGIAEGGDELSALQKIVGSAFQRLGGRNLATETEVKKGVGGADVVHLSVHGAFDDSEPLLSHLKLAKGDSDDGRLTAAEMFGLPLSQARLVVLSACESGRVEAARANEVLGMLRGLLYAGAGALVLSNWEVDAASTALWMETFYRAAQTTTLPEAAQRALLAVKATPEYAHPFYWGAFSLIARQ